MFKRRRDGGNPDANQGPLLALARRLGASVKVTSQVPEWVDATVGFRGQNLLWEVKRSGWRAEKKRGRKLTKTEEGQAELHTNWQGRIEIVETPDDVVRALLNADRTKALDYSTVPDDYLAAIVRALRQNLPDLMKGL